MKNIIYDGLTDVSSLTWNFGYTTKFVGNDWDYIITFFGDFKHECKYNPDMEIVDILRDYIVGIGMPSETILKVSEFRALLDYTNTPRRLHVLLKGDRRKK
jgi:hypothetical protein